MNLFLFTVPVVLLGLGLLRLLGRKERHKIVEGIPVYGYPRAYVWFSGSAAAFFLSIYWWGPLVGRGPVPIDIPLIGAVPALLILFFTATYRLSIDRTEIRSGAILIRRFEFAKVTGARYQGTPIRGLVTLYAENRKLRIWSSIADFASVVEDIEARLPNSIILERQPG